MQSPKIKICTLENKRCYTAKEADFILAMNKACNYAGKRKEIRKYECKGCRPYFHLTSKP